MTNCDAKLLQALRTRKPSRDKPYQLRLPSRLHFSCNDDLSEITIEMDSRASGPCAAENMQTDSASFEGWCVVIKSILPETKSIYLKWGVPEESSAGHWRHYQRFLYRVNRFQDRYRWFHPINEYVKDMRIRSDAEKGYYKVNLPTKARDSVRKGKEGELRSERDIEVDLVKSPNLLKSMSGATVIGNQLPIGVFEEKVARETAIFTGQASAIDLWGTNEESKTLSIFELKKPGNTKVGAVSELFFYAMVMKDLVDGRFAFDKRDTVPEGVKPWPPQFINESIKKINAYVLADRLHPLFSNGSNLFSLMNKNSSDSGVPVKFEFINYRDVIL